jgi:hypothetical protein
MKSKFYWIGHLFIAILLVSAMLFAVGCSHGDKSNPFANNTEDASLDDSDDSGNGAGGAAVIIGSLINKTLLSEDFEGTFPPSGWSAINNYGGSPIVWHRSDAYPSSQVLKPDTGYFAYIDSDVFYLGGVSGRPSRSVVAPSLSASETEGYKTTSYNGHYDSSLVTPSFSTLGMLTVKLQFSYQFIQFLGYETLALDYRIDDGPWINIENITPTEIVGYDTDPTTTWADAYTVDISETSNHLNVQLRWRYYDLSSGWDWWVAIDDVKVIGNAISISADE